MVDILTDSDMIDSEVLVRVPGKKGTEFAVKEELGREVVLGTKAGADFLITPVVSLDISRGKSAVALAEYPFGGVGSEIEREDIALEAGQFVSVFMCVLQALFAHSLSAQSCLCSKQVGAHYPRRGAL